MKSVKKKQNTKNMIIYIVIIAFALAITVSGVVFLKDIIIPAPVQNPVNLGNNKETKSGIEIETKIDNALTTIDVNDPDARKKGFYNFLVVGRDRAGLNTDVIMVVSFDTENNKAAILQIPRDTYIEASPSQTNKKINAIFAHGYSDVRRKGGEVSECIEGGMATLSDAILSAFGIVIDRYVHVNTQGFRQIVDAVGGVEVTIQQDMYYSDPDQGLSINLPAGTHLLNGTQSEGFVRFRSGYVNADLGRMDAQKIFMTAFMKKLLSTSTVTKIPKLISIVNENTVTDVSTSDMTAFGTAALKLDLSSVSMFTMQGSAGYFNDVSYVSMYPKANLEIVNNHFNVFNSPITIDDINVRILVDEPDGYTVEELTADDISKDPMHLNFVRGSLSSGGSAGEANNVPPVTANTETSGTDISLPQQNDNPAEGENVPPVIPQSVPEGNENPTENEAGMVNSGDNGEMSGEEAYGVGEVSGEEIVIDAFVGGNENIASGQDNSAVGENSSGETETNAGNETING